MKIAIVTGGTRGDVQPYVAVGAALKARGHDVRVATHDEYAPFVRANGLEHRTIRGSLRELMATDLGRAWLASSESITDYARYAKLLFEPLQRGWCEDADAAVEGADAVAFYLLLPGGLYAAERRGIPAAALTPYPSVPSRELLMSPAAWLVRAPGVLKRALGKATWWLGFRAMYESHLAYRESVGLPRYRAGDPISNVIQSDTPIIHLFSRAVLDRPADWASHHHVAGFADLSAAGYEPPPELASFVTSPAIYVGFGSMTGFDPPALTEIVSRAIRLAGVRAVVSRGWTELSPPPSEDIYVVDDVPHAWLFPRVETVVHHGGAGTLAAGLRAGRPTVVAAFFGDQPFWGRVNQRLGTGPAPLLRKTLTAESLAAAITEAKRYETRAKETGARLRSEDGAGRAAELLLAHFAREGAPRARPVARRS
jgi:sterol 3beta-glucosyltransferase